MLILWTQSLVIRPIFIFTASVRENLPVIHEKQMLRQCATSLRNREGNALTENCGRCLDMIMQFLYVN